MTRPDRLLRIRADHEVWRVSREDTGWLITELLAARLRIAELEQQLREREVQGPGPIRE